MAKQPRAPIAQPIQQRIRYADQSARQLAEMLGDPAKYSKWDFEQASDELGNALAAIPSDQEEMLLPRGWLADSRRLYDNGDPGSINTARYQIEQIARKCERLATEATEAA